MCVDTMRIKIEYTRLTPQSSQMHRSQNVKLRNRLLKCTQMAHILLRHRCHTVSVCLWCDVSFSSARCSYPKRAITQRCCPRCVSCCSDGGWWAEFTPSHLLLHHMHNHTLLHSDAHSSVIKLIGDPRYKIQYRGSEWANDSCPQSDPAHTSHQRISTRAAVIEAVKPRPVIHCSSSSSITPDLI